MTTDNPRELREAAERLVGDCDCRTDGRLVAGYVLATVRDDDGEEHGDVTIKLSRWVTLLVCKDGVATVYARHGEQSEQAISWMRSGPTTRGQFRALCRWLGIEVPG